MKFIIIFLTIISTLYASNEKINYLKNKNFNVCVKLNQKTVNTLDVFKLIEKELNLKFKTKTFDNDEELFEAIKNNKCDTLFTIKDKVETNYMWLWYIIGILIGVLIAIQNRYIFNIKKARKKEKELIQELLDTKKRLTYTIKQLNVAIWSANPQSQTIKYFGDFYFGYDVKTIETFDDWLKYVHPDDIKTVFSSNEKLNKVGDKISFTIRYKNLNGNYDWFEISELVISLNEKGNIPELSGLTKNITEKILSQQEKEKQLYLIQEQGKLASMGEMMANIAHQWRQPLNVISTCASAVKLKSEFETLNTENLNESLDEVLKATEFLSETIDTFRDFIKGDSKTEHISINNLLSQGTSLVKDSLVNNYIKIINNFEEKTNSNTIICLSKNEFFQVLINILSNAKDIILERKIEDPWVKIDYILEDNYLTITIEDNAKGVPKNILSNIFDPYFTTKHKNQGTGLGLYMSYKIVTKSLGGQIYVKNTQNGAKFFIKLKVSQD